jgi:hypothetical protein
LILSACIFLGIGDTMAQITIGSFHEPAKGALLDLKSQLSDIENVTSKTGGLLLPRVKLSDPNDFSLISNQTPEQKKNYTGLLVYNVKIDEPLSLEKGIYQWNGEKWKKLNKITKTENVTIKKKIYQAASPDETKTVSIGIFEFRIWKDPAVTNPFPQFKLAAGVSPQLIYWHVNEYWDINPDAEADGTGYSFALNNANVDSGTWVDCMNSMSNLERNEIWLADLTNNHMYQIQFTIINNGSTNIYSIIAKRY